MTFVTVHGVLTPESMKGQKFRWMKWLSFVISLRFTGSLCKKIIVHSEEMRRELEKYGIRNVAVIPHGSGPLRYHPQAKSRTGVLFFGFIRQNKGIEALILSFKKVASRFPNTLLTIAGAYSKSAGSEYLQHLHELVEREGLARSVVFKTRFISEWEKEALAAESAILVLPYTDRFLEVSGVVHDFSGYGLSLVCSRTPRFAELHDGINCLKVEAGKSQLEDEICQLLGDINLREKLAKNLSELAKAESWEAVGRTRLAIYAQH